MSKKTVTVFAPATSANIGPGFDVLGMALDIFCKVSFTETGSSLVITGCPKEFANSNNLAYVGFEKTLEKKSIPVPRGLSISIESDIPISRGLGSSSALIVAGICAANEMYNLNLSQEDKLVIATDIEGHPDNVAPCIYGGLVSSYVSEGKCFETLHNLSKSLRFAVIIPSFEVSTQQARSILPNEIPRKDAIFSLAHYGMLIGGFASADGFILREALQDKIHQPYRKTLIPCFDNCRNIAMNSGAFGLVISGSGSTMLVVGDANTDFNSVASQLDKTLELKLVSPCLEGSYVK